jgi:hypothetical protein
MAVSKTKKPVKHRIGDHQTTNAHFRHQHHRLFLYGVGYKTYIVLIEQHHSSCARTSVALQRLQNFQSNVLLLSAMIVGNAGHLAPGGESRQ